MKKILSLATCAAMISILSVSAPAETSESDSAATNEESFETVYSVEPYDFVEEPDSKETVVAQDIADTDGTAVSSVDAEVDGDKTSPDTGIVGVTGIVGTAILAAGTMMFTFKRK